MPDALGPNNPLDPEQASQFRTENPLGEGDPATVPELPMENPGLVAKAVNRLFGTDVDDPLPWTRLGTTVAGSIGGAMLGARVPGPPMVKGAAAIAGGLAGTAAGAAAPETTLQALEMTGILQPGERDRIGLSNEQLMTVVEGEAVLDAFTLGGVSIARGVGRGITSVLTGANRGSRRMAEEATREGIAMLPVQVGERTFARGFVSVMGRFPWVAAGLKRRARETVSQVSTAFDGIPQRLGPTSTFDEVSGRILREARETSNTISQDFTRRFDDLLARADMQGIRVRPVNVRAATEAVNKQLQRAVPRVDPRVHGAEVPLEVTRNHRDLQRFINGTVRRLYSGTQIADLTVRQMDTVLQTIDEKMVKYAESGDNIAMTRLERIRQAFQADMVNNAVSAGNRPLNQQGQELVREFRALDQDLTETVNFLFNSTTAQRLGSRISPTTRSAVFQNTGMQGADAMAKTLLRGDAPNAVAEIARLTTPETMQRLGNAYFTEAIEKAMQPAMEGNARTFDVEALSRTLGLNAPSSARYAQTEAILREAGGMSMDQLQTLVGIARQVGETEIPDVSTFIARQATFTGIRGAVRAAIPFATVAGAGAATAGTGAGLVMGALTIGGARMLAGMISNPASARALRRVLDAEATTATRRAAFVRATGFGIGQMLDAEVIDPEQAKNLETQMRQFTIEFDKAIKNEQYR